MTKFRYIQIDKTKNYQNIPENFDNANSDSIGWGTENLETIANLAMFKKNRFN